MEPSDLLPFARSVLGAAISQDRETPDGGVDLALYESFIVRGRVEADGRVTVGIVFDPTTIRIRFFGQQLTPTADEGMLADQLRTIDRWCRLHLPEKFLAALGR